MTLQNMEATVYYQRTFFKTGATISKEYRIRRLRMLQDAIHIMTPQIQEALKADLGKSPTEAYMSEIGIVLKEIDYQLRHIHRWTMPKWRPADLFNFPATYRTVACPYGVVLIMSPWNFPFQLSLMPLVGAIAAGNCCMLKVSSKSPATAKIIKEIVDKCCDPNHVTVLTEGRDSYPDLLDQHYDFIMFTGFPSTGRTVMQKAAENLTPVVLELGGKSPAVVAADANLKLAARRIAFGKWLNAGQACTSPEYVLVERSVQEQFTKLLEEEVASMFGDALNNDAYPHMIDSNHFQRVRSLIVPDKVVYGGSWDEETLKIEPTILADLQGDEEIFEHEIFGPLLPIIPFDAWQDAELYIRSRPRPLALYLFTNSRGLVNRLMRHISAGGGCVNDTMVHAASSKLAFGGVGRSGMGSYHGKRSFETFSHRKSVVWRKTWLDPKSRYQPYTESKDNTIKMLLH